MSAHSMASAPYKPGSKCSITKVREENFSHLGDCYNTRPKLYHLFLYVSKYIFRDHNVLKLMAAKVLPQTSLKELTVRLRSTAGFWGK